ncbi:hypothetical protein MCUN1_002730 [Malassezia cuniculi]|uniref:SUN domain-containing protein n=1 Tax=Malassezia cuniculi TaxID=948313 RepID=A0AAF0J6S3_9BASI|nr:hypothetical protein MCUN1_002730 [Malassezia cuniculi]
MLQSIHASILANDSLEWQDNDYTEEDKFVSQVEESTFERSTHEQNNTSGTQAHHSQPEQEYGQDHTDAQPAEKPNSVSLTWLLVALAILAAAYLYMRSPAVPDEPLIPSHGWTEAGVVEVKNRISQLENAVNRVWGSVNTLESETKKVHASLGQRIKSLEDRALPATIRALEADILELHTAMGEEKRRTEQNKKRLEDFVSRIAAVERNAKGKASDSLASLEQRISSTQRRVEELVSDAERRLQPVKKHLPEHMPVRFDQKTNMLQIDPAFWQELRRVFVTRDEPDVPSSAWPQFRESNEAAVERVLDGRLKDGAVLSRDAFLQLLDAEIARAKLELSTRFNENVQGLQNDILAKIKRQREMFEESGSWSTQKTDIDETAVQRLIDAALARFSADQIGRADYAQYSAGARVVPSLTSATHEIFTGSYNFVNVLASVIPLPQLSAIANSANTVRGRVPVVALHQDTSPGMCWPFSGTHGELGIRLVRRIHITAITIDHVPRSIALDGGASAPRDMEAWGILETDAEIQQLQRWRRNRARSSEDSDPIPVAPSPAHVFLGAFTYDASAGAPAVQTFPITGEAAMAGIPLRTIQVSFLSNHGLREFTCVYRVRVHGDPSE